MPHLAPIVVFARRHRVGTAVAMMLPCAVAISIVWILLFLGSECACLPCGPG